MQWLIIIYSCIKKRTLAYNFIIIWASIISDAKFFFGMCKGEIVIDKTKKIQSGREVVNVL